jgi:alpha-L-rhamnosidase
VFTLDVTVPPGSTATVYVPTKSPEAVTECGKPVGQADGVKPLRTEDGAAVCSVVSGHYQFAAPYAAAKQ